MYSDKQKIAILIEALQQIRNANRNHTDRNTAINALKQINKAPN